LRSSLASTMTISLTQYNEKERAHAMPAGAAHDNKDGCVHGKDIVVGWLMFCIDKNMQV
jgi:hypothetical protein